MKRGLQRGAEARVPREPAFAAAPGNSYFRLRDFEYVQPLHDLAFLLEVEALAKGTDVPRYRIFSLWRAAYSLDGYGSTISGWLDGTLSDTDLDYVPSPRIRQYLLAIRATGTLPELRRFRTRSFARSLRLRSVRGLGPAKVALSLQSAQDEWLKRTAIQTTLERQRAVDLYGGAAAGPWQAAHVVPPLLRLLRHVDECLGRALRWSLDSPASAFDRVVSDVVATTSCRSDLLRKAVVAALRREKMFRRDRSRAAEGIHLLHQLGWGLWIRTSSRPTAGRSVVDLARLLDPLASKEERRLRSDLHLHTTWSDGNASTEAMAHAAVAAGLEYIAITDHSRSSKLQGGLTPRTWLRQASSLRLTEMACPILHGIEVDIREDGSLDLPDSLLDAADIVVASVHSNWSPDSRANTARLVAAIESGRIDVLAHPTSAILGKPGVPDYVRPPADVQWNDVFDKCAQWRVALEFNCFPSRLDLPLLLAQQAIGAGCAISFGSDAHARSHLLNLAYGEAALRSLNAPDVLNRLSYRDLRLWILQSRRRRRDLRRSTPRALQTELFPAVAMFPSPPLHARIQQPQQVPGGSRIVGIDLTAGNKPSGVAVLDGVSVETCSLSTDRDMLKYINEQRPAIVSIDSPLGLPGGTRSLDGHAGIMRVAEFDLASVGIPAYPSLIDSMEPLTLRGIRLRRAIERLPHGPRVIESYPGAAQDILCIPRKQQSLELLRAGLRRLGLEGSGLETRSHDEIDAITSAVVGRFFQAGLFEAMGIEREAQLIVPKVSPLVLDEDPVICLAGRTGAGKSVAARYLSVFYGFRWIRTRDVIRELLVRDSTRVGRRLFGRKVNPRRITDRDLRDFGALILDKYHQAPLRGQLTGHVTRYQGPVVVDAIRNVGDVDAKRLNGRPLVTWFIDCTEAIIRARMLKRSRARRLRTSNLIDRMAPSIRASAHNVIPNVGTLEELRWRLDDALFATIRLRG